MTSDSNHTFTTASADATLPDLVLSAGTLSPDFSCGTAAHTVSVGNSVNTLT